MYKPLKYPNIPFSISDIYIITTSGDRVDSLAQQFYNDIRLLKPLNDPNNFLFPFFLFPQYLYEFDNSFLGFVEILWSVGIEILFLNVTMKILKSQKVRFQNMLVHHKLKTFSFYSL